jgi:hypothetical protein
MLRKATQELGSFQRHPFGFATVGVVFVVSPVSPPENRTGYKLAKD